jgi:peptidoglycan hydrolase-like protein with peptidoglycan-binding domain
VPERWSRDDLHCEHVLRRGVTLSHDKTTAARGHAALGRRSIWLSAAAVVLVACGSDGGDSAVQAAKARVTLKEKALSTAQADATAATAAFCEASTALVKSLDRYGDVLTATAPTVGDVNDAGTDLAKPREEAVGSAEDAVAAQEAVLTAERELAEAQAALTAAKTGSTPKAGSPSPSATPLAPAESVNRVKQADGDFTGAQEGINAKTPIDQASQQFNAAAVALEMSWMRLLADAGCLTDEQEKQAQAAVRDYTVALQKSLAEAGYYKGDVDGVYGPATVDAVESLQQTHGLPVTGTVDKATEAALRADLEAKGGAAAADAIASTAAIQQTLKLAGYWDGPVDGEWSAALTEAVKALQSDLGVKPTGEVNAATVAALEKAIAARQPSPSPSATPSSTSTSPKA